MTAELLLQIALIALNRSQELMTLYAKARAENRDLTDAEVASVRAGAVASNEALKALA